MKKRERKIWEMTKENAGIDKKSFFEYFCGKDIAHAYVLGKIKKYEVPKHIEEFGLRYPPQSYCYINVID